MKAPAKTGMEVGGEGSAAFGQGYCRFVETVIQEADAELQRQIPLERRLERAREYILKARDEEGVSLDQL